MKLELTSSASAGFAVPRAAHSFGLATIAAILGGLGWIGWALLVQRLRQPPASDEMKENE